MFAVYNLNIEQFPNFQHKFNNDHNKKIIFEDSEKKKTLLNFEFNEMNKMLRPTKSTYQIKEE